MATYAFEVSTDLREQTFNDRAVGLANEVSRSVPEIIRQHAILCDIDTGMFKPEFRTGESSPAVACYERTIAPMLNRDCTLRKAEVRCSGTGLHVLLNLATPVEFGVGGESKERWAAMTKAVQGLLPTDPYGPGIYALTRPVGSINSKNGAAVTVLKCGQPVTAEEIKTLYASIANAPFKTVFSVLFGEAAVDPCPLCGRTGKRLAVNAKGGKCYGSCDVVHLRHLYEHFFTLR